MPDDSALYASEMSHQCSVLMQGIVRRFKHLQRTSGSCQQLWEDLMRVESGLWEL